LSEEVIPLCAARAAKNNGDARLAINLLWKAGKIAERENAKKIGEGHVKAAFNEAGAKSLDLGSLEKTERRIIEVLLKKGEVTSGELYELLGGEADRTVRNHLKKLEMQGLIEMREAEGRGLTRVIKIKRIG
jgi:cell division control protein 6